MAVKKSLTELFDGCGPEDLDRLLPDRLDTPLSAEALGRIRSETLKRTFPQTAEKRRRRRWWPAVAAACLVLAVGATGIAYAAEVKEYNEAVEFFDENGLSTEGLTRADVKAVYRDITTHRFTCDKTAEVIEREVAGVEISQREPEPGDLAELAGLAEQWTNKTNATVETVLPETGTGYLTSVEERPDEELGFDVFEKCSLECWQDRQLAWTAEFSDFLVEGYAPVSDSLAVWGYTPTWSSTQTSHAWLARVDGTGRVLWESELDHGFQNEYIAAVLDNGDGTWAVISRGDLEFLCLSQYSDGGKELSFHKTKVGNKGIWNAACLGDGYLIQLGNEMDGELASLVKLDREGGLTDSFTYEGADCFYRITDMAEFNGRVYLSAYATPKRADGEQDTGRWYDIGGILEELFDSGRIKVSSEELTPKVRACYTAVLLVCNPEGGEPETFYSVQDSLGAGLSVSGDELAWDVESIVETEFSLLTSAWTIRGTCQVFRYTFDKTGELVRQEDTGETSEYYR